MRDLNPLDSILRFSLVHLVLEVILDNWSYSIATLSLCIILSVWDGTPPLKATWPLFPSLLLLGVIRLRVWGFLPAPTPFLLCIRSAQ